MIQEFGGQVVGNVGYRRAKKVAEQLLQILDQPRYRNRGYSVQSLYLSRSPEGLVTIKVKGSGESSIRLDPGRNGRLKLGRNIRDLAQHLLKDGIILSCILQVL